MDSHRSENDGDCPFFKKLRPINALTDVGVQSARSDVSVRPKFNRIRREQRGDTLVACGKNSLESGDFNEYSKESREDENDGCIRIHSLSSNATVIVPETNRNVPQVLDKVLRYEKNIRPRSAGVTQAYKGIIDRKTRTSAGDKIKAVPTTRPPQVLSASSSKTYVVLKNKKPEQDGNNQDSSRLSGRLDSVQSRHQVVRPMSSNMSLSYQQSIPQTGVSSRSGVQTASSQVVHQGYSMEQNELVGQMKKFFQVKPESYNEWRCEEISEEDENSRYLKTIEIFERLYERNEKEARTDKRMYYEYRLLLGNIVDLLDEFTSLPVPPGFQLKCRVTRVKKGVDGNLFPAYFMHLERPNHPDLLLMTAQKNKSLSASYRISTDPSTISSDNCFYNGMLKSNLSGCKFTLHSGGMDFGSNKDEGEILFVAYEPNPMGFNGPRKMKVTVPRMESDYQRLPSTGKLNKMHDDQLIRLKNKQPYWNAENSSYVMNFSGRVSEASVKNFQIIHTDYHPSLLQFGRVDKNNFILDFSYPFSPMQAFAVGLSSFDVKWGLE